MKKISAILVGIISLAILAPSVMAHTETGVIKNSEFDTQVNRGGYSRFFDSQNL